MLFGFAAFHRQGFSHGQMVKYMSREPGSAHSRRGIVLSAMGAMELLHSRKPGLPKRRTSP